MWQVVEGVPFLLFFILGIATPMKPKTGAAFSGYNPEPRRIQKVDPLHLIRVPENDPMKFKMVFNAIGRAELPGFYGLWLFN